MVTAGDLFQAMQSANLFFFDKKIKILNGGIAQKGNPPP